ncbi:hypothetical protein COCMIDRAFT_96020 [Bipolaris oryzae ATCC 44560]|uniref:Coenzyme Q-binding protein COQ10 START domain-containing protein n=1 Tax=Bipolaris oryzae ATCC 44560 TaxID=930090 RepID=W6Z641_COCMI|nr:uncharacterized protein COCMIDRAFT_96020 [Bipolaris oryzae ATCC 44560]EUC45243.1 hypothetical protein COCMIDRAFT_96020 [Bipolaris oryzae ATCC 44560]
MADDKIWPPANGLTTKVVPRDKAILELPYSTTVHAPAHVVFDTLVRTSNYSAWNTWIPSVRIISQPPPRNTTEEQDGSRMRVGTEMEFNVVMDASKPDSITHTLLKVSDISTPDAPSSYLSAEELADPSFTADLGKVYRVAWTSNGGMMGFAPQIERFHEVIVTSEDTCEVRNWELMSGMTARLVKLFMLETLQGKVRLWCEDLKKYCERVYAEGKAGGGAAAAV